MSNDLTKEEAQAISRSCVGCMMVAGVVFVAVVSMICFTAILIFGG